MHTGTHIAQHRKQCHSPAAGKSAEEFVEAELKATLEGLARHLFGQQTEVRWGEWRL